MYWYKMSISNLIAPLAQLNSLSLVQQHKLLEVLVPGKDARKISLLLAGITQTTACAIGVRQFTYCLAKMTSIHP